MESRSTAPGLEEADLHWAGSVELVEPDGCVISLRGEWDLANSETFRQLLEATVGRHRLLVVDLGEVSFADSTVIALALRARADQRTAGGDLRLAAPSEPVEFVLRMANLQDVFDVYPTRELALQ